MVAPSFRCPGTTGRHRCRYVPENSQGRGTKSSLDGESDAVCSVIADIRHQGRGGEGVWDSIATALEASDKVDALLAIGADQEGERCRAIAQQIRAKLANGLLGTTVYRKNTSDFEPHAPMSPLVAFGATAPAEAGSEGAAAGNGSWVGFDSAPFPDSQPPGNGVLIGIPPDFQAAHPFVVTLFLHGHDVEGCSQLSQIQQVPDQIDATTANTVLLVPRFGRRSEPGRFQGPTALADFIEEASRRVSDLLAQSGKSPSEVEYARNYLSTKAPIVIASFSGGCHPLKHLLSNGGAVSGRICGVLLLDSLYSSVTSPQPVQAVADWVTGANDRSWLLSLHSGTGNLNDTLMDKLEAAGIGFVRSRGDWSREVLELRPGTIAFSPARGHCFIPKNGPPLHPVAAALDRIDPLYAKGSP